MRNDGPALAPQEVQADSADAKLRSSRVFWPLRRSLFTLRWLFFLLLLLIAALWPLPTRVGLPLWATLSVFGLYNGLLQLAIVRAPRLKLDTRIPWLDLPVIAGLYAIGSEPAGAHFTLFVLALLSAAVLLPLDRVVVYTLLTMAVVVLLAPIVTTWSGDARALSVFTSRLLILPLVGIGAAVLTGQLTRAQAEAHMLQHEAEQLAELDRLRSVFIASISHDLSTPLTAINAGLGLLEDTAERQLRTEQLRLLRNARRNGERLKVLIDDLLTYNRLAAGALVLHRGPLDLREIAVGAVASVQALIQHKGQMVVYDLPVALPVTGDQRLLERVLVNLLCNANEHTPVGTRIVVTGQLFAPEVQLTVHDNGPGIPLEAHEAIFAPFEQLRAANGGSGLGLAIVRQLVELHGGRVWVESAPGTGTAFRIVLPCRAEANALQERTV